jgi:hypothetical protein
MTHERDIERLLDTWFGDGPTEVPDRVIDTVADRIARQPQRPAWRLTWRHHPLNVYLKPLALVAATILVAFLGFNLVGGFKTNSDVAAPSPTPSATPRPSPSPTSTPSVSPSPPASSAAYACDPDRTCAGLLPAGEHTSGSFSVPFTFTTPEGWVNRVDIPRAWKMDTGAGISTPILIMSKVAIAEQNAACDPIAKAGAGHTVKDFVDLLRTHPGLDTTDPVPVEVGGYKGQSVDFTVASTWTELCPSMDALVPHVLLLTDTGLPAERTVAYTEDMRVRWDILDVNGETVIIARQGNSFGGLFEEAAAAAQPVIDSINFAPSN